AAELLLIGRILNQGMLEDVSGFRREAALIYKFCTYQPTELVLQYCIIYLRNCPENNIGKLLPNRCSQLQNVLDSCKLVQPCQERILQGRRNRQWGKRSG